MACLGPTTTREEEVEKDLEFPEFVCSKECDSWLWSWLIIPAGDSTHSFRGAWLACVDQEALCKTGVVPSCREHPNFLICALDTVNFKVVQEMAANPMNNSRSRKARLKSKKLEITKLPKSLDGPIYEIYGGVRCAGRACLKSLVKPAIDKTDTVLCPSTDLHFCSWKCYRTLELTGNYHKDKNHHVLMAVALKFGLLIDTNLPAPVTSPYQRYIRHLQKKDEAPKGPAACKSMYNSQLIVSFNIQGNCNIPKAKAWIIKNKPAVIGLQELRLENEHAKPLIVPGYYVFGYDPDTALAVRNDLKIIDKGTMHSIQIPNCYCKIQGPDYTFTILNVYARNNRLKALDLRRMEAKSDRIIVMGDFNAKHHLLLDHTQIALSNDNGDELYKYFYGDDEEPPGELKLLNPNDIDKYTHLSKDGGASQIDLILTSQDLRELLGEFRYIDELLSDHKAIAVNAPGLTNPIYVVPPKVEVLLWNRFNAETFKTTTHQALVHGDLDWDNDPINQLAKDFGTIVKGAQDAFLPRKKFIYRKVTLPVNIRQKIKLKKSLLKSVRAANREHKMHLIMHDYIEQNKPLPPEKTPKWSATKKNREMEENNHRRLEIQKLRKEIQEALKIRGQQRIERELLKLSEIEFDKASKAWWETMKRIKRGRQPKTMAPIKHNGIWATEQKDIANLSAKYLEEVFQPLSSEHFNQAHIETTEQEYNKVLPLLRGDTPPEVNASSYQPEHMEHPYLKGPFNEEDRVFRPPNTTMHQQEELGTKFRTEFKKPKTPIPPAPKPNFGVASNWEQVLIDDEDPFSKPFTLQELNRVIARQPRKAPGHDGIYADAFKNLSQEARACLLKLYNRIRETGQFPDEWKLAIVALIIKKNKAPDNPASYRPISLLALAGKIFECLMLERMVAYLEKRKLIPPFQTGFRKGKSTSINLQIFFNGTYLKATRHSRSHPVSTIYFDGRRAFDSVYIKGLIVKAFKDGLPIRMIRFLHNWITNRRLCVKAGTELSDQIYTKSGVPQGSVLSPLIWNYWIGDCPSPNNPHVQTALYADDLAIMCTHPNVDKNIEILQEEVYRLSDWTNTKRMILEPTKSQLVAVHEDKKKRDKMKEKQLFLQREGKEQLKWQEHAEFLGVTFSETGSFDHHFKKKLAKAQARTRQLHIFKNFIDKKLLYRVYKAAIEPIVLYGIEVLYPVLNAVTIKRFNQLEFSAIRIIHLKERDYPTIDTYKLVIDQPSIRDRIRKRRENYVAKNFAHTIIRNTELSVYGGGRTIMMVEPYCKKHIKKDDRWKYYHNQLDLFIDYEETKDGLKNHTEERRKWQNGTLSEEEALVFPSSEQSAASQIRMPEWYIPAMNTKKGRTSEVIFRTEAKSLGDTGDPTQDWSDYTANLPRHKRPQPKSKEVSKKHRKKSKKKHKKPSANWIEVHTLFQDDTLDHASIEPNQITLPNETVIDIDRTDSQEVLRISLRPLVTLADVTTQNIEAPPSPSQEWGHLLGEHPELLQIQRQLEQELDITTPYPILGQRDVLLEDLEPMPSVSMQIHRDRDVVQLTPILEEFDPLFTSTQIDPITITPSELEMISRRHGPMNHNKTVAIDLPIDDEVGLEPHPDASGELPPHPEHNAPDIGSRTWDPGGSQPGGWRTHNSSLKRKDC